MADENMELNKCDVCYNDKKFEFKRFIIIGFNEAGVHLIMSKISDLELFFAYKNLCDEANERFGDIGKMYSEICGGN